MIAVITGGLLALWLGYADIRQHVERPLDSWGFVVWQFEEGAGSNLSSRRLVPTYDAALNRPERQHPKQSR